MVSSDRVSLAGGIWCRMRLTAFTGSIAVFGAAFSSGRSSRIGGGLTGAPSYGYVSLKQVNRSQVRLSGRGRGVSGPAFCFTKTLARGPSGSHFITRR